MKAPLPTLRTTERPRVNRGDRGTDLPPLRHIALKSVDPGKALCGQPRNRPKRNIQPEDEVCVVCLAEYERIKGYPWSRS